MVTDRSKYEWDHQLSCRKFYSLMLREVLEHSWGWADTAAAVLGILIPLYIHLHPKAESSVTPLLWEVPIAVFACLAVFRLIAMPYMLYVDHHTAAVSRESSLKTELDIERQKIEQPDVALIWGFHGNEGQHQALTGSTEKHILVHNRSNEYIYSVQIRPILLGNGLMFDVMNEIAPSAECVSVGRWDSSSSETKNYVYFFARNEDEATKRGWYQKKAHNRGLTGMWFKIPMSLTYRCHDITWESTFEFVYDPGDESYFTKLSGRRV